MSDRYYISMDEADYVWNHEEKIWDKHLTDECFFVKEDLQFIELPPDNDSQDWTVVQAPRFKGRISITVELEIDAANPEEFRRVVAKDAMAEISPKFDGFPINRQEITEMKII